MFDPRITLQQQVSDQLKSHFGDKVFDTVIPRNVRLAEAPSYGLPGVVFDPAAAGSQAFVEFAQEMVERIKQDAEREHPRAIPHEHCDVIAINSIAMKPSNVLLLPGWQNSGPQHWQSRWEKRHGYRARGAARLDAALARRLAGAAGGDGAVARRARGAGGAQPGLHPGGGLGGALEEHAPGARPRCWSRRATWSAPTCARRSPAGRRSSCSALAFPSVLVASRDDPYCEFERARLLALCLGRAVHGLRRLRPHQRRIRPGRAGPKATCCCKT